MKKIIFSLQFLIMGAFLSAAVNPLITSWIKNTTGIKGSHYVKGNSTPIPDNDSSNVLGIYYSTDWVYIRTNGIPAYKTGPFLDGNPSKATSQNGIFKFPLIPKKSTGANSPTTGGNIGIFINGVALFDYRDGVSWNSSTSALAGGPMKGMGDNVWNRDAVVGERIGFDCAKGHPAMGNYHHHQNPSAYNLDLKVISNVCDLYSADGLYLLDSTKHSPLIGFAYDGFPIYGAYGYKNVDGTGGISRIKSSYKLRNITKRNTDSKGNTVKSGPDVSTTYPLGYFREDYEYISSPNSDFLDQHNGRFCKTPEYPDGIYCYFTTVDQNWNSAYPYIVGPTFYGNVVASKVTSISEKVDVYTSLNNEIGEESNLKATIFPNPANDIIAVQINGLTLENLNVELFNLEGKLIQSTKLLQGSTITYFDARTLYNGNYIVKISSKNKVITEVLTIQK